MATPMHKIYGWLVDSQDRGATHVLVICDKFTYEDFPIACKNSEECNTYYDYYEQNKTHYRVVEVYDLSMDIDEQLMSPRAWNLP